MYVSRCRETSDGRMRLSWNHKWSELPYAVSGFADLNWSLCFAVEWKPFRLVQTSPIVGLMKPGFPGACTCMTWLRMSGQIPQRPQYFDSLFANGVNMIQMAIVATSRDSLWMFCASLSTVIAICLICLACLHYCNRNSNRFPQVKDQLSFSAVQIDSHQYLF